MRLPTAPARFFYQSKNKTFYDRANLVDDLANIDYLYKLNLTYILKMAQVKICGITNLEDGLNAVALGADYVGFVFYEKSPRNVSMQQAREISQRLDTVKKVGLFVNEVSDTVRDISRYVGLQVLQLHGNESPQYCSGLMGVADEMWKAIRVRDEESLAQITSYESVDAFVLDAYVEGKMGGTGMRFDWELAIKAKSLGKRIVLAGGLDSYNVREAIITVDPFAVDVSSGVEESKGKKSYEKMKAFIEAAKSLCSMEGGQSEGGKPLHIIPVR